VAYHTCLCRAVQVLCSLGTALVAHRIGNHPGTGHPVNASGPAVAHCSTRYTHGCMGLGIVVRKTVTFCSSCRHAGGTWHIVCDVVLVSASGEDGSHPLAGTTDLLQLNTRLLLGLQKLYIPPVLYCHSLLLFCACSFWVAATVVPVGLVETVSTVTVCLTRRLPAFRFWSS